MNLNLYLVEAECELKFVTFVVNRTHLRKSMNVSYCEEDVFKSNDEVFWEEALKGCLTKESGTRMDFGVSKSVVPFTSGGLDSLLERGFPARGAVIQFYSGMIHLYPKT